VILDEPTSAVDLGAETDWLRRFRDLPRDAPLYWLRTASPLRCWPT